MLKEKRLQATIRWIQENEGKVETACDQDGNITFSIEANSHSRSPEILLDFGKKVTGYVVIKAESHSQDFFELKYGPVEDCLILPLTAPMGMYQSEHYVACRYLRVGVSSKSLQPQRVFAQKISLYLLPSQYPVDNCGSFCCDNEKLNRVFQRGAYTLELCMQKNSEACWYRMLERPEFVDSFARNWRGRYGEYVIYDAPRRDREAWLGDLRAESLLAYTAFGAYDVVKNTLSLFYDLQREDGNIPGSGSTWMDFVEFAVWGMIASWECYEYTGDKEFLAYMYPHVTRFVAYAEAHCDERGFLFGDGSWMWTFPREGYNCALQMLYAEALRCISAMEREMNNGTEAERLSALRNRILQNINETFWDEERGVYREVLQLKTPTMPVFLDVNCYAVVFHIATPDQAKRILAYIKEHMWCEAGSTTLDVKIQEAQLEDGITRYPLTDRIRAAADPCKELVWYMQPHNKMVWPFMNAYEVEARFLSDDIDGAFELISRCWDDQRFSETGTFWEIVDPENPVFNFGPCVHVSKDDCYNSAAHGFSGWIAHLLQAYVLGVKPKKPGFAEVSINPHTGSLTTVEGTVPTPRGSIQVHITKTESVYALHITAPATVTVIAEISEQELACRKKTISITNN